VVAESRRKDKMSGKPIRKRQLRDGLAACLVSFVLFGVAAPVAFAKAANGCFPPYPRQEYFQFNGASDIWTFNPVFVDSRPDQPINGSEVFVPASFGATSVRASNSC
jgi:hypothetical protein